MGWLLMLLYNMCCMAIFRIFKIPLTRWTLSTAAIGGVFIIGTLLSLMNYQHPYSAATRQYFHTTPVIPDVAGRVTSVNVEANKPLKAGDVLFTIDPEPYQYKVDSLTAQLKSLEIDLARTRELVRRKAGNQKDLDAIEAKVGDITGKLGNARYDLERTVVKASADGFVSQLFIHKGNYVVATPLRPAAVFINSDSFTYVAWFRQNNLARLDVGNYAEIAFDSIPGEVFAAEVKTVVPVLSEGELQATGNLYDMSTKMTGGRIPVVLTITAPEFATYAETLPGGAFGQAAVYSEEGKQVAFLRKILIRMNSWMCYLFPFR